MRMSRGFSMDTLRPHEYDIPLDRGGHLEGPHVFGFLINTFLGPICCNWLKAVGENLPKPQKSIYQKSENMWSFQMSPSI